MSSSTLVNVTEDAELRLVKFLAESAPVSPSFVANCEQCIVHADASGLLKSIVADSAAIGALLVLQPQEEAVSAFSVLCALLERVKTDRPQEESALAKALSDAVVHGQVANGGGGSAAAVRERRIALLTVLYNLRSDGTEKCSLLAHMIQLADASMLTENLPLGKFLMCDDDDNASAPRIARILDRWNVSPSDRRDLYKAAASAPGLDQVSNQRFTLLLVGTYADSVDSEGLAASKAAAIGAIKDPVTLFTQQRTMLTMKAVQALEKESDTKVLYGLLKIFQESKLQDYLSYVQSHGGEAGCLAPYGLSAETCERHMRILSLVSLASEHEEIPYSNVAQTLQVDESEVETWVVAAVSSGLLFSKMDQLQKKVMVERAVVRKFDMAQWKALQEQLQLWKANVEGILGAFEQQAAAAQPSVQP
uniref:Eukaryotic translation initiation factor 3 subunit M n=1 Tax=Grammatophora oceanica TaxID=210454 RepID=A0A7S1VVU9_9STRA|mmetsp:Transcript_7795/g.11345  ORF Transcript_7795/g.11345 Transcript_7795/m.11345 type:complete len:421 (+) Transcript_7795:109-1371(+)